MIYGYFLWKKLKWNFFEFERHFYKFWLFSSMDFFHVWYINLGMNFGDVFLCDIEWSGRVGVRVGCLYIDICNLLRCAFDQTKRRDIRWVCVMNTDKKRYRCIERDGIKTRRIWRGTCTQFSCSIPSNYSVSRSPINSRRPDTRRTAPRCVGPPQPRDVRGINRMLNMSGVERKKTVMELMYTSNPHTQIS